MTQSAEEAPAVGVPEARIPDFFIAGQPKCGTTALYEMLKRHPQIYMSEVKEPHYFAVDNPLPEGTGSRRWTSLDQTGVRTHSLERYLSLFAPARADQLAGEATTSYLWSPNAARRISELQPAARIIGVLREPASFLRSVHLQLLVNGHETETDFRKAVSLDDDRRQGRHIPDHSVWPSALIYSDRVRYVEQLRRYDAVFPKEQLLVLVYDDYRRDNEGTMRRVLRFLDVDSSLVETVEIHPTIRVRSRRLRELTTTLTLAEGPVSRAVNTTVKAVMPRQMRHDLRRRILFGKPAPPDEEFALELRRRFKDEVVALSEYLDRDLVRLWGYDRLD
jgi:hypothetical protein